MYICKNRDVLEWVAVAASPRLLLSSGRMKATPNGIATIPCFRWLAAKNMHTTWKPYLLCAWHLMKYICQSIGTLCWWLEVMKPELVIPLRLFGDGAESFSCMAINRWMWRRASWAMPVLSSHRSSLISNWPCIKQLQIMYGSSEQIIRIILTTVLESVELLCCVPHPPKGNKSLRFSRWSCLSWLAALPRWTHGSCTMAWWRWKRQELLCKCWFANYLYIYPYVYTGICIYMYVHICWTIKQIDKHQWINEEVYIHIFIYLNMYILIHIFMYRLLLLRIIASLTCNPLHKWIWLRISCMSGTHCNDHARTRILETLAWSFNALSACACHPNSYSAIVYFTCG